MTLDEARQNLKAAGDRLFQLEAEVSLVEPESTWHYEQRKAAWEKWRAAARALTKAKQDSAAAVPQIR